ncbi:MAG: hypothetical protein EVB03_08390 [SAR92 clade bacterium]|uniref:DUF3108 domain-containing protein n=1 Tax=SAR92 clade bacterium TaxID=2315479 RepID=A0A520MDH8_9GAMM|nr:MAG: hypothetical protein EVB03_08390 [SAR92 clade bacterium]
MTLVQKFLKGRRLFARSGTILLLSFGASIFAEENATEVFNFKVSLDNREVGWHRFVVETKGNQLTVSSKAKMDFTVLMVKKVAYRHEATENWLGDCLQAFESKTKRNTKIFLTSGSVKDGDFYVNRNGEEVLVSKCVKTFAYWRPAWLDDEFLLNVETGKYTPISLEVTEDQLTNMTKRVVGLPKTEIHLAYDKSGNWQTLESELKIAGTLRYQRINESVGETDAKL